MKKPNSGDLDLSTVASIDRAARDFQAQSEIHYGFGVICLLVSFALFLSVFSAQVEAPVALLGFTPLCLAVYFFKKGRDRRKDARMTRASLQGYLKDKCGEVE